jgi:biofilm PGA synthesis lipoprotein PgaB
MVTRVFIFILLLSSFALPVTAAELTVLNYHDVVPNPGKDAYAVSRSVFVAQMDYLAANGYQVIGMEGLVKIVRGEQTMPDKAVMLTFDDGLISYYEFVVPLLKIYGYPSVAGVVTSWLDGKDQPKEYQGRLMSWSQLREVSKSPLVEVVSHTHDLHRGIPSNPQGNVAAASVTRQYLPFFKRYETEPEFQQRVAIDLKNSVTRIKQELGYAPRGIVWPYGLYDQVLIGEASKLGMIYHFTLDEGPTLLTSLPKINRILMFNYTNIKDFVAEITYKNLSKQHRFVELSLDSFFRVPAQNQEQLLSELLDRLEALKVNTVLLSPFSKDGSKAFFANDYVPVADDILNRVLHLIRTKLPVKHIYLKFPEQLPFPKQKALYADLARLNWFNGVVFKGRLPDKKVFYNIVQTTRFYRPMLKVGYIGKAQSKAGFDFIVVPLDVDQDRAVIRKQVTKLKGIPQQTFIKLDRLKQTKDETLAGVIQLLKSSGIQNYGYGPDNYLTGLPQEKLIAKAMAKK